MQRFKITAEIDQPEEANGKVQKAVKEYFGSSLNFLTALKKDQTKIFSFIKHIILKQTPQAAEVESTYQRPRKQSDPSFENDDFLKRVEDGYAKQFEA